MKSGLYYPNRFARITLLALEEVIGSAGMKAVFNMANLPLLAEQIPPDNMECQFDFADLAQLFTTIRNIFGVHGARSLTIRAGRVTMQEGIRIFANPIPAEEPLPEHVSIEHQLIRFNRFSNFLNSVSDLRTSVYRLEDAEGFKFTLYQCPVCWDQKSPEPMCTFLLGMLEQAIKEFSNNQSYTVTETGCVASGSSACVFILKKQEEIVSETDENNQESN